MWGCLFFYRWGVVCFSGGPGGRSRPGPVWCRCCGGGVGVGREVAGGGGAGRFRGGRPAGAGGVAGVGWGRGGGPGGEGARCSSPVPGGAASRGPATPAG